MSAILSVNGGDVTTLVRMAETDPISPLARRIDPGFSLGPHALHYDGVYHYAVAIDPFMLDEAHELIDQAAHRYGQPGYGWLTWLVSAGRPTWAPTALVVLSLLGVMAGGFFTSLIARALGASGWMGLAVAFNPGLVFAVAADLAEAFGAGVLTAALWLWLTDRRRSSAALLALLCFLKFQLVLVPLAIGLWETVRFLRGQRDRRYLSFTLGLLAVGPVLFAVWQIYVYVRLGEWFFLAGPPLVTFPVYGFLTTMGTLGNIKQAFSEASQLFAAMMPILVCVMGLFVLGVVRSLRFRHVFDAMFLLQGLIVLSLNDWNLFYPKELLRVIAIPLLLLLPVMSSRLGSEVPESA